ncbi:hypothetical protein [Luteipulveratus flavus]|uniref:Uncharacterized protein n=1 Tax=Luteipulveratus flavus TaxID=3031728 RepID=A0ABT6C7U8_9MICO|nr:hypothetical protein [Luteipulveratus sp. YIM 133296]MDF8265008.1 hypothetical protein [Luteipulveratus sp. YIM 133296]
MSPTSDAAPTTTPADRLVQEALSKSGLLWIRTEERTWPVWHASVEGTAYVVSGPGEQPLPELPERVWLVLRSKDSRARLLTVPAAVRRIGADDAEWAAATAALRSSRLNSSVPQDRLVDHWAEHARVLALEPDVAQTEIGAAGEEESGAAPPLPTDAVTR